MTIRWGIAGPGSIATVFAKGLAEIDGASIVSVCSRSAERARHFAERVGAERAHGSYEALAEDPDVDIVYVATPASRHADDAVRYLEAGKHVLCEKPFSLSASQGERMASVAQANGRFLMEAMWSRFLPAYQILAELLTAKEIGEPLLVEGDFGYRREIDPRYRSFDLAQGGGALLDLGIYPIQLASMVLGTPEQIVALGQIGETGVDEMTAAILKHSDGSLAIVKAAIRTNMSCTARISGTDGVIEIPAFMHCPGSLTVRKGSEVREIDASWQGEGMRFEAMEVQRCILEGLTESPVMPLADSLSVARTLDAIRSQIGLSYPSEIS